jgi:hypothetical protein
VAALDNHKGCPYSSGEFTSPNGGVKPPLLQTETLAWGLPTTEAPRCREKAFFSVLGALAAQSPAGGKHFSLAILRVLMYQILALLGERKLGG